MNCIFKIQDFARKVIEIEQNIHTTYLVYLKLLAADIFGLYLFKIVSILRSFGRLFFPGALDIVQVFLLDSIRSFWYSLLLDCLHWPTTQVQEQKKLERQDRVKKRKRHFDFPSD